MNKNSLKPLINKGIKSLLNEATTGSIELKKTTPESEIKKYTSKGYNVKLNENQIQDDALKVIKAVLLNNRSSVIADEVEKSLPYEILDGLNEKDLYITRLDAAPLDEHTYNGTDQESHQEGYKIGYKQGYKDAKSNKPSEFPTHSDNMNEAKDEDEPEIKDDWNKADKDDNGGDDDESIDKNATKGAKKVQSKAAKLDFVIKNLRQCESDIKDLVTSWKSASPDEKPQFVEQLKEKNKLKKELEELQEFYSNTLVKENDNEKTFQMKTHLNGNGDREIGFKKKGDKGYYWVSEKIADQTKKKH